MSTQQYQIPPMTNPLGKYWDQPNPSEIIIDNVNSVAIMSTKTFNALSNYSTSNPSGAYEGKMWRARWGGKDYLRWYGISNKPGFVSNNQLEIVLTD